jgi:hypothetical protein
MNMKKNQKKKKEQWVDTFKKVKKDVDGTIIPSKENIWNAYPKWSFRQCDFEYEKWCFKNLKVPSNVLQKLKSYEYQTYGEICRVLGTSNTHSHYIWIKDLCDEAQKRINKLKENKPDLDFSGKYIFSLYLTSQERLWGLIRSDGTFFIIWYDPHHEVYPVAKKHT